MRRWVATLLALALPIAPAVSMAALAPLMDPPWRVAGLPKQSAPMTRFDLADVDGRRALRVAADGSYGNLVHALASAAGTLSWDWRVDQPLRAADLRTRSGDDSALKVCAMFDLPLAELPFWERQKMLLARRLSGEELPAATLCYVWDPSLTADSVLPNAYSARLRWWVLRGQGAALASWQHERRDLKADFLRAFGAESTTVPRLVAIAIGADADNTGGQSLGYVADIDLTP